MSNLAVTQRVEALRARLAKQRAEAKVAHPVIEQGTLELLTASGSALQEVPQRTIEQRRPGRPSKALLSAPTERQGDLFLKGLNCAAEPAREANSIGYLTAALIYASLPHSEMKDANGKRGFWKRQNGDLSISIQNDPDIGLPYGKLARLIVAFLCTEAKRTTSREVVLGRSQSEFLRKLGLNNTGGKNGDIGRINEQARRLFTSTITLLGNADTFQWRKVEISPEGMLLWNPHNPHEKSRWNSILTLGERFYADCIEHSVPFDMRVIHALRSPLAIDIYVWLTYRYQIVNKPTPISWARLYEQFGGGYPDTQQGRYDFKSQFRKQLANVKAIYQDAHMSESPSALTLLPSRPHISA